MTECRNTDINKTKWTDTGIDETASEGSTRRWPVIHTVIHGTLDKVKDILSQVPKDNREKVLATIGPNKNNALHYAAKNRKNDVCAFLLENGSKEDECYHGILRRNLVDAAIKASMEEAKEKAKKESTQNLGRCFPDNQGR